MNKPILHERRIVSFVGFSGSGKTTFIERLIKVFKSRGLSVAAIKHDAHNFDIDYKGKDSYRFFDAGSDFVAICSNEKSAIIERETSCPDIEELIKRIPENIDIIIVEGFRKSSLPKIGISRKETGKGFSLPLNEFFAVITDEMVNGLKSFGFNDVEKVADYIVEGKYIND